MIFHCDALATTRFIGFSVSKFIPLCLQYLTADTITNIWIFHLWGYFCYWPLKLFDEAPELIEIEHWLKKELFSLPTL